MTYRYTKESFLKTATVPLWFAVYFVKMIKLKQKVKMSAKPIELNNDPNSNQNDENFFERLQTYIKHYSTHSIQSITW